MRLNHSGRCARVSRNGNMTYCRLFFGRAKPHKGKVLISCLFRWQRPERECEIRRNPLSTVGLGHSFHLPFM